MNLLACLYIATGIALITIGAITNPPVYFGMALGVLGLLSYVFGVLIIRGVKS